jgi:hypothetical protein
VEGRERCAARDDGSKVIVSFDQPLKNLEDEVVVRDGTAKVGHALHLATVVAQ